MLLLFQDERVGEDLKDRYSLELRPITHDGASTSRDVTKRRRSSSSEDEPCKKFQKIEKPESHFLNDVRLEIVCLKNNYLLNKVSFAALGQHRNRKRKSE